MRFWIFLILCAQLYANPFDRVHPSSSEEIASLASHLLIDGYVSCLSGQLVLSETDLHVQGAQDLLLTRSYIAPQILGGYAKNPKLDRLLLGEALLQLHTKGWVVFPHLWAGYNLHSPYFQLRDPQGFVLEFAIENNHGVLKTSSYGCTNLQQDTPSSFVDLRNIKLTLDGSCVDVLYPNGLKRFYQKKYSGLYRLEKEYLPNGKAVFYKYTNNCLTKVYAADRSETYIYASIDCTNGYYLGSDGKKAHHSFETKQIKGKHKQKAGVKRATYGFLVMKKANNPTYSNAIDYNDRTLLSSYDGKKYPISCEYFQNQNELAKIKIFSTPSHSLSFFYDPPIAAQKEGYTKVSYPNGSVRVYRFNKKLLLTAIENHFGGKLYNQKLFTYDKKQHISSIAITDANKIPLWIKYFTCDKAGNPIEEIQEGEFGALHIKRNFVNNRLIREEKNGLVITYTYLGDTHLITSKTTYLTGKPIRKTIYTLYQEGPNLHRVQCQEKKTVANELIHKTCYFYDCFGNVTQEDHYGSNDAFAYSIQKVYDKKGDLLEETNPLGQKAYYTYDKRGRPIKEIPFSNRIIINRTFDEKGRLILLKEKDHITQLTYNSSDLLVEKIDYLGLKTTYSYHPVHNKPVSILKEPTSLTIAYDDFGRETVRKDALGSITKTTHQNPIEITHPGGGKETLTYDPSSRLVKHIDPDGLQTLYSYDPLDRLTSKQVGAYLTSYTYDPYHLVKEQNPQGFCSFYQYNLAGQKIAEEKEQRTTKFTYDPLGFLASELRQDRCFTYQNDHTGRVLQKNNDTLATTYTYDSLGNISSVSQGEKTLEFSYDPYSRLIETIDGAKTVISYEEKEQELIKTIQDPLGAQTIETYNAHNLLTKREVPNTTLEEFSYDKALQLIRQDHLSFTYTPDGDLSSMTESNQRTTFWTYSPGGKRTSQINPDGTILSYKYNSQKELIQQGDRSFSYDRLGRIIRGTGFTRVLDPFGNILEEMFSNGLWVQSSYDDYNRPIQRTLPDQSSIVYQYEGPFLKKVTRLHPDGSISYFHTYNHNEMGQIVSKKGQFTTTYTYDSQGRKSSQKNPYFQEQLIYDLNGNLIQKGKSHYSYDPASRLISEKDQFIAGYDEHHNCIEYNKESVSIDSFNQMTSYSYDLNGNLQKPGFQFDLFNQLTFAEEETYTYDALGRRLQKGDTSYLYIDQEEIASFEKGICKELKVPGENEPTAIEINGHPYDPIIDIQGTIRYLIDHKTKQIAKENHCNPFGENLTSEIPYAYAGKRYDPETNLVYFGKRYYDPSLRRWLTPDPLGPINHSNLYQYVFNNPFRYQDPDGQFVFAIPLLVWGGQLALPALTSLITPVICGAVTGAIAYGGYKLVSMVNLEDAAMGNYQPCFYAVNVSHYQKEMAKAKDKKQEKENDKQRKGPPEPNVRQNDQAKAAKREVERKLGRKLTRKQKNEFHRHVTKQGYTYQELVEEGYWLFHKN